MKQIIAAWSLGIVLAVAFFECASNLPSLTQVDAYGATERLCVTEASTRDAAETCIASTRTTWCRQWPSSCLDGGAE